MRRWLTPSQLGEQLAKTDPRVAKLNRKRRREYAVRLVQRVEKLEEIRCLKRVGARILVSWRALESLLPPSVATVDLIDTNLAVLSQDHRHLRTQVNGYGSALRDHQRRISVLEEKEAARREFEAKIQLIESRNLAADLPQKVPSKPILKRARKLVQRPSGQDDGAL